MRLPPILKAQTTTLLYRLAFAIPPLRSVLYTRQPFVKYPFMYTPNELHTLLDLLRSTRRVAGSIVEVGCHQGWTTCYLTEAMKEEHMTRPYICIDTFSGFLKEDTDFEHQHRQKPVGAYASLFQIADKKWFDFSMRKSGYENVHSYKADAAAFDYASVAPIAFCLVDVDLYRPVKASLAALYAHVSPGGLIVVDDSREGGIWDGANQAYREFCQELQIPPEIVCDKMGIIRKS